MSPKEAPSQVESIHDEQGIQDSGQGRSTIKFPYQDLDDAIGIAKGVHEVGGTNCQKEQLAAYLNLAATGGGFGLRLITAKLFGLINTEKGTVSLTPLGFRICDTQQEKAARADAFLNVPLYSALYEQFKTTVLPANAGLEGAIESLGVAPKQKDKARQVFQRSATQAGFFAYGNNRLVMPSVKATPASEEKQDAGGSDDKRNGGVGGDGGKRHHPLIEGLIKALPDAETEWSIDARRKWLQAAAMNFDFVYSDSSSEAGSIKVTIERENSGK